MIFKEAFELMKQGIKIKLPEWSGYWSWENETIKMYCSNDVVVDDIRETENLSYTLGFIMRDNWEIADETNNKLLQDGVVNTFTLGEAIIKFEADKTGNLKIARKGWNGKDQFLYYMQGTDLSTAFKYGYGEYENEPKFVSVLVLKTTNNMLIVGWTPSQTDLSARDYYIVN